MFLEDMKLKETVLLSPGERISPTEVGLHVMLVLAGAAAGVEMGLAVLAEAEGPTVVLTGPGADFCANK
jgi:hypothetical protein